MALNLGSPPLRHNVNSHSVPGGPRSPNRLCPWLKRNILPPHIHSVAPSLSPRNARLNTSRCCGLCVNTHPAFLSSLSRSWCWLFSGQIKILHISRKLFIGSHALLPSVKSLLLMCVLTLLAESLMALFCSFLHLILVRIEIRSKIPQILIKHLKSVHYRWEHWNIHLFLLSRSWWRKESCKRIRHVS